MKNDIAVDNIESPELSVIIDKFSPFLKEVRKRVIFTLISFAIATVAGFVFHENIIRFLVGGLSLEGINIVFTSPFQFINLAVSCGLATGLVLTVPLILFQVLSFLRPALKKKEFKMVTRFLPFSIFLLIVGFAFGVAIMKWQIEIFLARSISLGIGNILDVSGLLTVVLLTSALLGVGFQFPIVLLLLLRLGVVEHKQLSKRRPWVYLGSFIFTIFLPPDSVLADIILSLPLISLFEATLLINFILERKKRKALVDEDQEDNK
ncbi:twin-arginine translocase subunit TatC [Patescibacteria group bacterium]